LGGAIQWCDGDPAVAVESLGPGDDGVGVDMPGLARWPVPDDDRLLIAPQRNRLAGTPHGDTTTIHHEEGSAVDHAHIEVGTGGCGDCSGRLNAVGGAVLVDLIHLTGIDDGMVWVLDNGVGVLVDVE